MGGAALLAAGGCASCTSQKPQPSVERPSARPPATAAADTRAPAAPVGVATMQADGTLILDLRAEGPGGALGDARFVYPKAHPDYRKMLDHIGGLRPGESKPVPPWP
jgi:hypothetical protein